MIDYDFAEIDFNKTRITYDDPIDKEIDIPNWN